ncbi:MAG: 30S ribosomal protein S3 [bacterium]|nr:30S ribosomal protein S3 [bacterium]
MAHSVHPKIFRIRETKDWLSRWFNRKKFGILLREDHLIRFFLEKRLKEASIERVEIERSPGKVQIIIASARPGLIIGRGGSGIEALRKDIQRILLKGRVVDSEEKQEITLDVREIKNPWISSALTAQWIASQLERRMPHRRTIKQGLMKVMANKEIKGARIEVAGRLGGADIARKERVEEGQLPRQTMRADIEYALREAFTTYGTIGVKIWLYKGEKFEEKKRKEQETTNDK